MKAQAKKIKKSPYHAIKRVHHAVKMAVIPHKKNNYFPHIINRFGILIVIVLAIGIQFVYNFTSSGEVLGVSSDVTVVSLLDQTNEARSQANVAPLRLDEKLNAAAYLKAQDMIEGQYWAHVSPGGTQPWKWFGDVDYKYSEAGENLAKNFYSTKAVMTAWMNSPEHKKNIVNTNYQDVGFAIVDGVIDNKAITIIVALYGKKADSLVGSVAGAFNESNNLGQASFLTQFAVALQSITPAAVVALCLVFVVVLVASVAHTRKYKLPKNFQKSWKKHHALYKALGMTLLGLIMIFIYSHGQI